MRRGDGGREIERVSREKREEREDRRGDDMCVCVYVCIYIYIYMYAPLGSLKVICTNMRTIHSQHSFSIKLFSKTYMFYVS